MNQLLTEIYSLYAGVTRADEKYCQRRKLCKQVNRDSPPLSIVFTM